MTLRLIAVFYLCWWLLAPAKEFRSRRSPSTEARYLLAGLYVGEKAYEAENGRYTSNLVDTGIEPEGKPRYVVGFSERCRRNKDEVLNSSQFSPSYYATHNSTVAYDQAALGKIQMKFTELPCHPRFPEEWEAYAVGEVGGEQLDIWRITDKKEMSRIQDGEPTRSTESRALIDFGVHLLIIAVLFGVSWIWTKFVRPDPRPSEGTHVSK